MYFLSYLAPGNVCAKVCAECAHVLNTTRNLFEGGSGGVSEWPDILACLRPRGFLGCGTFSAKTRKVPGRPG